MMVVMIMMMAVVTITMMRVIIIIIIIIIKNMVIKSLKMPTKHSHLKSGDVCLCQNLNGTRIKGLQKLFGENFKGMNIRGCRNECTADPNSFCGGHLRFSFYKST